MATILQHAPGQLVTVMLQILDTNGEREDGYSTPMVERILLPDLTESPSYPLQMIRIDTGLYYHRFYLPSGSVAVGSYLVDLSFDNAAGDPKQDIVQVICLASGGSFSISPS